MWEQVLVTVIVTLLCVRIYLHGARVTRPRRIAARRKPLPPVPRSTKLHVRITIRRYYK